MLALLAQCAPGVAPDTMAAVVMAESRGDPLKIQVNSGARLLRQPQTRAEATQAAKALLSMGASFDAGLAQVNSANFRRLGLTAENVFDACTNVAAGATVLRENYEAAVKAGSRKPLAAALSLYNTGSLSRGLANGYVDRVRRAAGLQPEPVSFTEDSDDASPEGVARLLLGAFGGRITDTWRPWNAAYGAEHSYHKTGQAVDFVPAGGVHAITRSDIRSVLARNGITVLELLGPGDAGHDNHWHVAFARRPALAPPVTTIATLAPATPVASVAPPDPEPPSWDIFALNKWKQRDRHDVDN